MILVQLSACLNSLILHNKTRNYVNKWRNLNLDYKEKFSKVPIIEISVQEIH